MDSNHQYLVVDSRRHKRKLKELLKDMTESEKLKLRIIDARKNSKKVNALFGKDLQHGPVFANFGTTTYSNSTGPIESTRRGIMTKPSGTFRKPSEKNQYVPQQKWGAFSASAGNNRAGNSIPCGESGRWLSVDRSSPNFPQYKAKFGKQKQALLGPLSDRYMNHRGKTGFDQIPKSIYQTGGGPVLVYSFSPYTGSHTTGILPRPYGPIDNTALKGRVAAPNANVMKYGKRKVKFGKNDFDFGRYTVVNKTSLFRPNNNQLRIPGFNSPANKGLYLGPSVLRSGKTTSVLPGWNAYQQFPRTPKQKQIAKAVKAIGARAENNVGPQSGFGMYRDLYAASGPNNVAFRNPFLMYNGAGGDTRSFLRNVNYLPLRKPLVKVQANKPLVKVQANKNPTGYLAEAKPVSYNRVAGAKFGKPKRKVKRKTTRKPRKVVKKRKTARKPRKVVKKRKVKRKTTRKPRKTTRKPRKTIRKSRKTRKTTKKSKFGSKWSTPKEPWVMKDSIQRPFTTELVNTNIHTGSGPSRIGQPLELYTYQNTSYGGKQYPAFLGPRMWYGGFGKTQVGKKTGGKKKTTGKKTSKKIKKPKKVTKKSKMGKSSKELIDKIQEGDVITLSAKGEIKSIKKSK